MIEARLMILRAGAKTVHLESRDRDYDWEPSYATALCGRDARTRNCIPAYLHGRFFCNECLQVAAHNTYHVKRV